MQCLQEVHDASTGPLTSADSPIIVISDDEEGELDAADAAVPAAKRRRTFGPQQGLAGSSLGAASSNDLDIAAANATFAAMDIGGDLYDSELATQFSRRLTGSSNGMDDDVFNLVADRLQPATVHIDLLSAIIHGSLQAFVNTLAKINIWRNGSNAKPDTAGL